MTYIKNINFDPIKGMEPEKASTWKNIDLSRVPHQIGVGGTDLYETLIPFNSVACEKVIKGKNDSYIVLGRDRFGNEYEGKGMMGEPRCSMIDMVVGRQRGEVPELNKEGQYSNLDPDFFTDAARIYISQRTDVDGYFNLPPGKSVPNFTDRSAIALKADGIRVIGREGIKLVTGGDEENSLGMSYGNYGIDLIALNDGSDIQPIPKGENLRNSLKRLSYHVRDLNKIVKSFLTYQMKFNAVVQSHTHVSPFWGDDTSPSMQLEILDGPTITKDLELKVNEDLNKNMKNIVSHQLTYLEKSGKRYILSKYNNTN